MAKVQVPQKDGEIRIARDGEDPVVYPVTNGTVDVDDNDVEFFLVRVEGSSASGGDKAKPAETPPTSGPGTGL